MTQLTKEELHEKFESWINKFKLVKREEMSKDLSIVFLSLLMMESNHGESDNIPKELNFSYQVSKTRSESIGLEINQPAIFLIITLSNGIPGTIIMFLYYMRHYQLNNNEIPITMELIARKLFPSGFPAEESLNELWDEQKVDGDNLLDFPTEILFLKKEN